MRAMNRLLKYIPRAMRYIAVVALLLTLATNAMAQEHNPMLREDGTPKVRTEWGIGIGGSYTLIDHQSDFITLSPRLGYEGHLHMGILLGNHFAIEGEISYAGGSIDALHKPLDISRRVRTTTINIPVLLSLRLWDNRLQFDLGPLFTVRSSAEYTLESNVEFFGSAYPTWNVTAGVGVRLFRNLMLDIHYIYPLATTHNHFVDSKSEFTMHSERVAAGLTLLF